MKTQDEGTKVKEILLKQLELLQEASNEIIESGGTAESLAALSNAMAVIADAYYLQEE